MFYLNFLRDKYKVTYVCGTPMDENHYRIHLSGVVLSSTTGLLIYF